MGKTPGGQSLGPTGAAQLSALAGLYNTTLTSGLNALGGNVLRIDNWAFLNDMLANPASYGIVNTTRPACGTTGTRFCARPPTSWRRTPTPTYAFADGNHPTGGAHVILAQAVASMIEGPQQAATLTEGPLAVEQAMFRAVDARMWSALDTPYAAKGVNVWASYDYANPDIDVGLVVRRRQPEHAVGGRRRAHQPAPDGRRRRALQPVRRELRRRRARARRGERDDLRRLG